MTQGRSGPGQTDHSLQFFFIKIVIISIRSRSRWDDETLLLNVFIIRVVGNIYIILYCL